MLTDITTNGALGPDSDYTSDSVTDAAMACPALASPTGAEHAKIIPPWYALVVRADRAFRIRDELRRIGVAEFLPTYSETTRWSDRTKISERQLFPGYLFARLNGNASHVLDLPGVRHVLPNNFNPKVIEDSEINSLRIAIDSKVPLLPHAYVVGEKVTIARGALTGASGVVVRTRDSIRVIVGIEMLGRAVSVTVDAGDLEKAS